MDQISLFDIISIPEDIKNPEKNIILELAPFSNFCTNCASVDNYPFQILLDKGVRMCLNTDDMAIIGNHLIDEFAFIEAKRLE